LLTGGPAAGKSTTSRRLAVARSLAAVVDVDDIRQLVVAGHAAPWDGAEGLRQQRIGAENACDVANRFLHEGIEVVVCDVASPATAALYRRLLPRLVIVQLRLPAAEARRRAASRSFQLTEPEFEALHALEARTNLDVDHTVDVAEMTSEEQAAAVQRLWAGSEVA